MTKVLQDGVAQRDKAAALGGRGGGGVEGDVRRGLGGQWEQSWQPRVVACSTPLLPEAFTP